MLRIEIYAVIFSYLHPMRPYCLLAWCLIGGFATAMLPHQTRPTIGFANCHVWFANCTGAWDPGHGGGGEGVWQDADIQTPPSTITIHQDQAITFLQSQLISDTQPRLFAADLSSWFIQRMTDDGANVSGWSQILWSSSQWRWRSLLFFCISVELFIYLFSSWKTEGRFGKCQNFVQLFRHINLE